MAYHSDKCFHSAYTCRSLDHTWPVQAGAHHNVCRTPERISKTPRADQHRCRSARYFHTLDRDSSKRVMTGVHSTHRIVFEEVGGRRHELEVDGTDRPLFGFSLSFILEDDLLAWPPRYGVSPRSQDCDPYAAPKGREGAGQAHPCTGEEEYRRLCFGECVGPKCTCVGQVLAIVASVTRTNTTP